MRMSSSCVVLLVLAFLLSPVTAPPSLQLPHTLLQTKHTIGTARFPERSSTPAISKDRKIVCHGVGVAEGIGAVNSFLKDWPYAGSFLIAGFKGCSADALQQMTEEDKAGNSKPFCWSRSFAFLMYAGGYQGCIQYFMFNKMFRIWFGAGTDVRTVMTKVCFELFVLSPFLCLPLAYLTKAVIFNGPSLRSLLGGLSKYTQDIMKQGLLKKYWMLWCPVQTITFSVIPAHLRISFIAFVSFFWMIVLSRVMNRKKKPKGKATGGESGSSATDESEPVLLFEQSESASWNDETALYNDGDQEVIVYWQTSEGGSSASSLPILLHPHETTWRRWQMNLEVCVEYCGVSTSSEQLQLLQPLETFANASYRYFRCPAQSHLVTCKQTRFLRPIQSTESELLDNDRALSSYYVSDVLGLEKAPDLESSIEDFLPGLFPWPFFLIALAGNKQFTSFRKGVWPSREPLMHT